MTPARNAAARLIEQSAVLDGDFAVAVVDGLSASRKTLPCRYFYDARGSALFEDITRLPEYYPTRVETDILKRCAAEIAEALSGPCALIEFGSGSSTKTENLLDRLADRVAYVPIDVSEAALDLAGERLRSRYPSLEVHPILGDFWSPAPLAPALQARQRLGFFPGSTIGNLPPDEAVRLLASFRTTLGCDGRLIVGVDLKKDPRRLVQAYNDAAGVTAAFNLNLLQRINRELGGDFDLEAFSHDALYNPREGRIEMHIVSRRSQEARVCGLRFRFGRGETIHTENSYKYRIDEFQELARRAGWIPSRVWTDPDLFFSVHELTLNT